MKKRFAAWLAAVGLLLASVIAATAATADTVRPQNTTLKTINVNVGTHNTLHGKADMRQFAGIIGWQEVDSPAARDKLRRRTPDHAKYFAYPGPAKSIPISWNKNRYRLLKKGYRKTHGGEAKVTPSRYIVWVKLQHRATGKKVMVFNTHFISGAWNKHPNRQARWLKHYEILKKVVRNHAEWSPNAVIYVVGDFNRRKAMWLPKRTKWVGVAGVSGVPIDQIYAQKYRLASWRKVERLYKWGSDHHAYRFRSQI